MVSLHLQNLDISGSIYKFWRKGRRTIRKEERKEFDGILVYFWCNILKERNRRIFQHVSLQPLQLAFLIKKDINLFKLATGNNGSQIREGVVRWSKL
jgi:hypothetical protein